MGSEEMATTELKVRERNVERGGSGTGTLLALLLVALLVAGWLAYDRWFKPAVDPSDAMLLSVQKLNKLTVLSARLVVISNRREDRMFGMLHANQTYIVPGQVTYSVDLSRLSQGDFNWSEKDQRLSVTLPPVTFDRPTQMPAQARIYRDGALLNLVSQAQERMLSANFKGADAELVRQARNPQLVQMARSSAKEALEQTLAFPLKVAGFDNATVEVHFNGEATAK